MLGFAPLATVPLASTGALLITVASPVTATGGLTFGGAGDYGARTSIEATGGFTFSGAADVAIGTTIEATGGFSFGGSPVWTSLNALTNTGGITFGGHPHLRAAGKPLIVSALPSSFTVRADMAVYEITALTASYTLRGVK